ncbi:hypothetical protein JFL59_02755 [Histophilus somni]|uniref:hypothetical protein n=1 Tax=Histophilus somni TaxID=731 RepID=UPI0018EB6B4B|nr:hypothetical protein [Histophilus somni]QQF70943.1 hypothetical protein JFL59_02755 [Histophilus somni]
MSEISCNDNISTLKLGADNATVELAHDKSKLELKDNPISTSQSLDSLFKRCRGEIC